MTYIVTVARHALPDGGSDEQFFDATDEFASKVVTLQRLAAKLAEDSDDRPADLLNSALVNSVAAETNPAADTVDG